MHHTTLGEMAALGASVCFTLGPTLFTLAGRIVGSLSTNRLRLLLGAVYFMIIHWVAYGAPIPKASTLAMLYLLGSGVFGLALADAFMFEAFVLMGPRLTLLVLNTSPVLATALAWIWLREHLKISQIAAILVVISGVSWVVLEQRTPNAQGKRPKDESRGIIFALIAAAFGALSLLLAKNGLKISGLPAVSGATIRMLGGMVTLWSVTLITKKGRPTFAAFAKAPKALRYVALGVLIGPVIGMSLNLFAVKTIPVGVAATLSSLPPILMLPIGHWLFHEKISGRAILGTIVATAGVIWLIV